MSFGKDKSQLSGIGSFRQTAKMHQQAKPKMSGASGGNVPYFINQFKPSTNEPDQVRIIKGTYDVSLAQQDGSLEKNVLFYFPFTEHFHGSLKKGSICSAGPLAAFKDKRDPCYACDLYWADKMAGKKNGPMSKREMYAFTVLHYASYAKVPQLDRHTGQPRANDKGEVYTTWQRFYPHERQKFAQYETRDWNLMHWALGFGHYNTLIEYDKEIGRSCKACGGRDTIRMEAWCCRSCGDALIEASTTTMPPQEIEDITSGPVRCAGCGHVGLLQEYVSCSSCSSGTRAEIFDVDISVKRIADPHGGNQTTLAVTSWSNPRAVDQRFIEVAKPLPLDKTYAPTPYEKQLEVFGGSAGGGRAPVTTDPQSRPYQAPTLGHGGKVGYNQ